MTPVPLVHRARRIWPSAASVVLVGALVLVTSGDLASARQGEASGTDGTGAADAATEFPSPLVVPVLAEGVPPNLAVSSFFVSAATDPSEDSATEGASGGSDLVVRFAQPFRLPEQGRYRVAAHFGDPTGEHRRVSLVVVGGVSTGVVEIGNGDEWEREGRAEVTFDEDEARLELPGDLDPAEDMVWVEATHGNEGRTSVLISPLVTLADLLGTGATRSTLTASELAWGSVSQPPAPPVRVPDPPGVTVDGDEIVVTYPGPPPVTVDGREVETMIDVVRMAPDFEAGGNAPWLVAIDHQRHEVALLDGTMPVPAAIPNDGSWVLEGYPGDGIEAGTELVFDLDAVLEAFGFAGGHETAALGVARSLVLGDGTRVRPDGVLGTLQWFEGDVSPVVVTTAPEAEESVGGPSSRREATAGEGSDSFPLGLVAAGCVAALVLVAGWLTWRWWRYRYADPYRLPERAPVTRSEARQDGEADALTDQLFGQ